MNTILHGDRVTELEGRQMLQVRPYTPEDEAACLAVLVSNSPRYFDPSDVEDFRQFLGNVPGKYYVGVAEGEVLACAGCYVNDNGIGGLTWGMVHSLHHRRGWGSELLRYRLEVIRSVPHAWCVLLNTTQLVAPFFERFGFKTYRVIENKYGPGLHKLAMRLLWVSR